ncbi:MAG: 50S ribosomal protein L29 [Bacillota bacterium]|nr:50S ribosomal protein L29 [Bacillota bacterium]
MEVKEFRELSPKELDAKIYELKSQLFDLTRKQAVGQLEHGDEIKRVRKDIAKAKTVKRERELNLSK